MGKAVWGARPGHQLLAVLLGVVPRLASPPGLGLELFMLARQTLY